ncbi:MAG: hypothetical protein ABIN61_09215 [candidate division WOR-3 bacterium]
MNRGIRMIKKSTIILIFLVFPIVAKAEPYKPYPILFVHGLGASSGTWGAKCDTFPKGSRNSRFTDSIINLDSDHTYDHFLDYMTKYAWAWYDWEKEQGLERTYTPDTNAPITGPRFPNKTFLEVVNFDDNRGSIDPDPHYPNFNGQGDELWHRVKDVLDEYYGEGQWQNDRNAKVILVGHSMGGLAGRQAIILFLSSYLYLV